MATYRNRKLREAAARDAAAARERAARAAAPIERARERGRETADRVRRTELVHDDPCGWCGTEPPEGEHTARVLVQPATYTPAGVCLSHGVYAYACWDHLRSLKLIAVDTRNHLKEMDRYHATVRAEGNAERKTAQLDLFSDTPQNPLLKDT